MKSKISKFLKKRKKTKRRSLLLARSFLSFNLKKRKNLVPLTNHSSLLTLHSSPTTYFVSLEFIERISVTGNFSGQK